MSRRMMQAAAALVWLMLCCGSRIAAGEEPQFAIEAFDIYGSALFEEAKLQSVLAGYLGAGKSATDVEKARDALERLFHESGYPTVFVHIPEQSVDDGTVRLQVIESRIRRVRVTGNRYFTMEKIRGTLPSLQPGKVLYLPAVKRDLWVLNRSRDLKVAPVLIPVHDDPGAIDVELKVKDHLPLHGYLEVNNRCTHNTTDLRLNGMLEYRNLWQRSHGVSAQFQTSPLDTDEVKSFSGSYVLPSPWSADHTLVFYGIWSDSDITTGEGLQVVGKGRIFGVLNVMPLTPTGRYGHNLTAGLAYKDFEEQDPTQLRPMKYLPLSFRYNGSLPDAGGATRFSGGINMVFRGLATDRVLREDAFTPKDSVKGNYLYGTLGVERRQKLPRGFSLFAKLDGQLSSQALISNERFYAGGVDSVRGYKETEISGDDGLHGVVEAKAPHLGRKIEKLGPVFAEPYAFFDFAWTRLKNPGPGEEKTTAVQGAGIGAKLGIGKHWQGKLDWAMALAGTADTESGSSRFHFLFKYEF